MHWLQRLRRLRAEPAEAAVLAFIVVAGMAAAAVGANSIIRSHSNEIVTILSDQLRWVGALSAVLSAVVATATVLRWRRGWRRGWLATVPAATRQQSKAQAVLLAQRSAVAAALLGVIFFMLDRAAGTANGIPAPPESFPAIVACGGLGVAFAALLAPRFEGFAVAVDRRRSRPAAKFSPRRAVGSLACWQRAAIGRPHAGIGVVLVLLLIPGGESTQSLVMLGIAGISAALLLSAWRQSTAVIVRASALLRAQPLTGRALLRQTMTIPLVTVGVGAPFCLAALGLIGLPIAIVGLMLAAIWAVALLHFACVGAWRLLPRRIASTFSMVVVMLALFLQVYVPVLPLIWILAMVALGRRALRQ